MTMDAASTSLDPYPGWASPTFAHASTRSMGASRSPARPAKERRSERRSPPEARARIAGPAMVVPYDEGPTTPSPPWPLTQTRTMFARYFVELPIAPERVEHALAHDPSAWLPGLAERANHRGDVLLA